MGIGRWLNCGENGVGLRKRFIPFLCGGKILSCVNYTNSKMFYSAEWLRSSSVSAMNAGTITEYVCVVKTAETAPEYPRSACGKDGHWLKQEIREVCNRLFCAVISPIICSKSWSMAEMKPLSSQKWSHISEHAQEVSEPHFCFIFCVFSTAVSWCSRPFTLLIAVNEGEGENDAGYEI